MAVTGKMTRNTGSGVCHHARNPKQTSSVMQKNIKKETSAGGYLAVFEMT
jgi:hypothetical protein